MIVIWVRLVIDGFLMDELYRQALQALHVCSEAGLLHVLTDLIRVRTIQHAESTTITTTMTFPSTDSMCQFILTPRLGHLRVCISL